MAEGLFDATTRYYPLSNVVMSAVDFSEGGYLLTSMEYRPDATEDTFSGLWTEATSAFEAMEHSGFAARFEGEPYVEICKVGREFESIQDLAEWLKECHGIDLYIEVSKAKRLGDATVRSSIIFHVDHSTHRGDNVKTVNVVAAIIKKENAILATERGSGDFKGGWEFPGGKIEPGETPEEAIVREIHEELNTLIRVERHVVDVAYDYPTFHLEMGCYLCSMVDEGFTLLEHMAARWLHRDDIDSVDWLPADVLVVDAIKQQGLL